jgi:peptide-methionine (S)-S-oxide reductase
VIRTTVGYAGGTTANPTYHDLGDHAESIEIEFDPALIGYQDLLAVFWASHDPLSRSISRQYRSAVFWSGEGQRRLAEESRRQVAGGSVRDVATAIEPLARFTPAEDYHQKYYLRSERVLAAAYRQIYPQERDFAASTAVARVNGYLGGHGGPVQLAREIEGLGLGGAARAALEAIVRQRHPAERCAPAPAP